MQWWSPVRNLEGLTKQLRLCVRRCPDICRQGLRISDAQESQSFEDDQGFRGSTLSCARLTGIPGM